MQLIIGEKNYSTWSMRPWLLLRAFNVSFTEIVETLADEVSLCSRLLRYSPTARVPVLQDGDTVIWDSLAICEYVSETRLSGGGWPADAANRAQARALTAEMHAGFVALRTALPMNIRARRRVPFSDAVLRDVRRINEIWAAAPSGGWLCGEFSIADCFYAPVAMRFLTYADIPLSAAARAYGDRLAGAGAVQEWCRLAFAETTVVAVDEVGDDIGEAGVV